MVKFLNVIKDKTLSFRKHVAAKAKSALYGIHLIKSIQTYLTLDTTKMLMCALVLSQLDYINSILTNTPLSATTSDQKVQNQAAQIVYIGTKWNIATSCMKSPHLLPIRYRSHCKLLTFGNKTLHGMGPMYLSNRPKIKNNIRHRRQSTPTTLPLDIPFNRKKNCYRQRL